jgi:hypothetical protein
MIGRLAPMHIVLVCLFGSANALEYLTADTFDKFISDNKVAMVEWACIYEKNHLTDYATAANKLDGIVTMGMATVRIGGEELCTKNDISSYPQYSLYRGGAKDKHESYLGDEDKIVEWIEMQLGRKINVMQTLQSEDELETLTARADVVFVATGKAKSGLAQRFEAVANSMRSSGHFAFLEDPTKEDTLVVYRTGEEVVKFDGKLKKRPMRKFIKYERLPLFASQYRSKLPFFTRSSCVSRFLTFNVACRWCSSASPEVLRRQYALRRGGARFAIIHKSSRRCISKSGY